MSEKFRNILEYLPGADAYIIWSELNPGVTKNVNSAESIKELIDFFAFAISQNVIIEYDTENKFPVFSGDTPKIVAQRIFMDLSSQAFIIPDFDPVSNSDFLVYLMLKRGWAVLFQGTQLVFPE